MPDVLTANTAAVAKLSKTINKALKHSKATQQGGPTKRRAVEPIKEAQDDKAARTEAELSIGLKRWVADYKETRADGNVRGAKSLKAAIEAVIKSKNLDAKIVWGEDPDLVKQTRTSARMSSAR